VDGRNRRFREGGHWLLDAGAFLQALEYGASCEATVLGKPSAAFFAEVVQSLGLPAARCRMWVLYLHCWADWLTSPGRCPRANEVVRMAAL